MSEHSKFSILTNELRRRFEVLDDRITIVEKISIVDHFTKQLANSGYKYNQVKDIIVSSLVGVERGERKRNGKRKYRSCQEILSDKMEKKLTEEVNWFRFKRSKEEDEWEEADGELQEFKWKLNDWKKWRNNNIGVNKSRRNIGNH